MAGFALGARRLSRAAAIIPAIKVGRTAISIEWNETEGGRVVDIRVWRVIVG